MWDIALSIIIVAGLGLIFGLLLSYASKKFEVEADPKIAEVREVLPGANCGACGFKSCDNYAEGVATGGAKTSLCSVGGQAVAEQVAEIMGVKADETERLTARVFCQGSNTKAKSKFEYKGIADCTAANMVHSGPRSCKYACMGLGSCVRACEYGAIVINDGIAHVHEDLCVACKKCVPACPKNIIKMVPAAKTTTVRCSSNDTPKVTMKNCSIGCISCKKCANACKFDAIAIENNLAVIDHEKCTLCGACVPVCPTKAITL